MPNFMENLGLNVFNENDDSFSGLLADVCTNGRAVEGYYGYPYLTHELGWAQFVARSRYNADTDRYEITGLDTHMSGITQWTVRLSDVNMNRDDSDVLEKRVVVKNKDDGTGMVVIDLVMADVLPSFLKNDLITVQVVGFPALIHYYKDEDAYAAEQQDGANGSKYLLADGSFFPAGIFMNHSVDSEDNSKNQFTDGYMLLRGTVKRLEPGTVTIGDGDEKKSFHPFLTAVVGTQFGDLEIAHTLDQVDESEIENIKIGSLVFGVFSISGDVAIGEYENGLIRDAKHNYALMRYILQEGKADRMRAVLKPDSEYISEASQASFIGPDEIVDRFKYVRDSNPDTDYYAFGATITSVDEGTEALPYGEGTRCLVLATDAEDNYESIVFLDTDPDGYISRILISQNGRYHFRLDEQFQEKDPLEGLTPPKTVLEAIIMRARFHRYLPQEVEEDEVRACKRNLYAYRDNARQFIAAAQQCPDSEMKSTLENVFGYLFAKAMELEYSLRREESDPQDSTLLEYDVEDGLSGTLSTDLPGDLRSLAEDALKYGKQFQLDFTTWCKGTPWDDDYRSELEESLVFVQQIGEIYARDRFVTE